MYLVQRTRFCRIYPLPRGFIYDWEIIDVEVRLPTRDRRERSYALFNYENDWPKLNSIHIHKFKNRLGNTKRKKLTRSECIKLVKELAKDTFSEVRDKKRSFGLIKPKELNFFIKKNKEKSEAQVLITDLDISVMDQKDYAWLPYLEYSCEGDYKSRHPHKQKIVSWEAYEYMRKNPDNQDYCMKLKENYHIGEKEYEHFILIGNMFRYPKSYSVIKLIRFKTKTI